MAGTREILYSLPVATRLPTKSSIYSHFNRHLHQHNRLPRSNYLPYDSGKRLLVQRGRWWWWRQLRLKRQLKRRCNAR
ncbi:hypothetical protein J1N35_018386 [Gossypium stocksii]|uniref:Uncharacterized protein n=1 Tax=Gossypium stocksii TaxID=47602 RepID=A0A9D3VPS8_9ROSI|nr:hypothetical protein J1N35_018386 [Gossypium stocksii]